MSWLPDTFTHPARVDIGSEHHIRPISASDVDLDMVAVMGSQERLFSIYGQSWGWPPATMTREQDLKDLEHHVREMQTRESYNYAIFGDDESQLLGCIYIDQPDDDQHDAVVSWWVINDLVGRELDTALESFVPSWLKKDWPFSNVRFGVWVGE